jgi:hypothetical protein
LPAPMLQSIASRPALVGMAIVVVGIGGLAIWRPLVARKISMRPIGLEA